MNSILRPYIFIRTIAIIVVAASMTTGQIKYIQNGQRSVICSGTIESMNGVDMCGAQVLVSKDGFMGAGMMFEKSFSPDVTAAGVLCEVRILKATNGIPIGINAEGSFSKSWSSIPYTSSYEAPYVGTIDYTSEQSILGNSFDIGGEFYYYDGVHALETIRPFVQFALSFSKVTSSDYTESNSTTSIVFGFDALIPTIRNNAICFTPAAVVEQKNFGVGLTVSYLFCKN